MQANAGADFVRQRVETFAEEAPRLVIALRTAAAATDREAFETAAHTLKSNGVTFGAIRLAEMARHIEWQGLATPASEVDVLASELDASLTVLRALAIQ